MLPHTTGAVGATAPARPSAGWARAAGAAIAVLAALAVLYLVVAAAASGQYLLALGVLVAGGLGLWIYLARPGYTWRYLYPGVLGMAVFVIYPIAYTVRLGFTNYSSPHLLGFGRATQYLLDETVPGPGAQYEFEAHGAEGGIRLVFTQQAPEAAEDAAGGQEAAADGGAAAPAVPPARFVSPAFDPTSPPETLAAAPLQGEVTSPPLPLRRRVELQPALRRLTVEFPDGTRARLASLREFAPLQPAWVKGDGGTLVSTTTEEVLTPDHATGFYRRADGEPVRPGFKVDVGLANYARVLTDPVLTQPLLRIFAWTVAFALLTVLLTLAVGLTLAVVLDWEALPGRTVYRTLLFLPYAVPAFISILVFRGIFSTRGELNQILQAVLDVAGPAWLASPWLARMVLLAVNTWLGYPYILILATGLIKAIPHELYEAAAMAGAGPLQTFRHVTAPLIVRPLTPLLISSFAFNFNNFVLVSLLTQGRPDFLDARVPAGTTDILVSYTYRIAFQDSGQQFGLAAAISTVIFLIVAGLSLLNLRLTRGRAEGAR